MICKIHFTLQLLGFHKSGPEEGDSEHNKKGAERAEPQTPGMLGWAVCAHRSRRGKEHKTGKTGFRREEIREGSASLQLREGDPPASALPGLAYTL